MSDATDQGWVFNIQHYSLHDGPGIRTCVFLKGCPLRCHWCCNPESQNSRPELGLRQSLCNGCGRCLDLCPRQALSLIPDQTKVTIDRAACDNCGACVEGCAQKALAVYGQTMTVEKVVEEVSKDAPFYRRSGGGVTITGGEALAQPAFVARIIKECRRAGFHIALETSGYAPPRIFEQVLSEIDLVLFDLKMLDPQRHRAFTGKSNRLILENARLLANAKVAVQPRMPLIPGINDSDDDIRMAASFLQSLRLDSIELMPYHEFGKGKYTALGRAYKLSGAGTATPEDAKRASNLFERYNVECKVSI